MMKFYLIIFFSFICKLCFSQNAKDVDSLMNILKQNKVADSERARSFLNLANILVYNYPDSSMKYTDEAMQISQKIKWQKGIASSLRQKGLVYYILSDNLNAMDFYLKALKAGEGLNNKLFNASLYNNIANIYADLKEYDKALDYYGKYLATSREAKSTNDELNALNNIGNVYTELNDLSAGLDYFKKALAIAGQIDNKTLSAAILNNMGEIFLKEKNYSTAFLHFQKSIKFCDEIGNRNIKTSALNGIAEVYLNNKSYKQAENFSNQSLQLAKELNDLSWQTNALETLSKIYERENDFSKALNAYKQSVVLRDSTLNDDKKQQITRLEMQYDFDKKEALARTENEKKHVLAVAEIKQQQTVKNAVMAGGIMLLIASVAVFVFYKRRRDAEEEKHEAEFKVQTADTEMKALRSQMNPHFIFNSLNSINDYIYKHDTAKATLYTTKFAKLMRLILENSEQKEIPLADDLKALELYMQLESLRLQDKFTYEIIVDDDIDKENTLIPPLILQPFVENSIWHGFANKEGKGNILIHIKKEGEMINCIVDDNGGGMAGLLKENTERKSLGMKLTNARIDIINKLKKANAGVQLFNKEEGVRAEVRLPLELSF